MNQYGLDLNDYKDDPSQCTDLLAQYLKQGFLGLYLGAGVSYDIGLPSWHKLVQNCLSIISPSTTFSIPTDTTELKKLTNKIKHGRPAHEYLEIVRNALYDGIKLDFRFAKKDLLIALTSLIIGKTRGNVSHIVTLNFDSVLEWYLKTNGLSINVSTTHDLFKKNVDAEITHLHGFLPYDSSHGDFSNFLIFTKEEFEDREVQYDYWKGFMEEFYRSHVFLAVGISSESIVNDICKYLRKLNKWYEQEKIVRDMPYGIAFITPNKDPDQDIMDKETMIRDGIIPCTLQIPDIPEAIFSIPQKALV